MDNFYIYMYSDQNNIPFYVGKGSYDRYKISKHSWKGTFNPFLTRKIRKAMKAYWSRF